jgi:hypothetical protein
MEKIYPIDIFGVKNIGIEEWLENYYVPVTGKEYQNIYENILHAYTSTLKKYDNDIVYWLAISNIKLKHFISRYIFNLLRLSRLKEAGFEYVIGQKKEKIADNFLAFPVLAQYKLIDSNTFHPGFQERMKDSLRLLKYNIPGAINRNFLKNISNPTFLLGYKTQKEVVSYCNAKKIFPIQIFPMSFAKNRLKSFGLCSQDSEMTGFVHDFLALVGKKYPIIKNSLFEAFEKGINQSFECSSGFFKSNIAFFSKIKRKTLLVTGIGNSIYRLFCSAWRYSGGEVIGFVHGNSYCTAYTPRYVTDGFLSNLNQYVTTSKGSEKILKQAVEDFPLGLKTDTNITHSTQNIYYPLYKELQKCIPVREIKKVMIIGFPMDDYMYAWLPERYTFSSLHLELRLVKLLKASGYYVIYKAHPDRISEVEGIFEGYADKVFKKERFEDVYDMADCLLFSHAYTTTFGFSLLSKKPIVLINVTGETWFPKAFELLKKRCCIIDAEPDDSGRILFNDQDVIDAVGTSLNNIDYEILHEFAF